ncbi:SapC family protein [Teredinibacter purpureus]|uniref:SapC family protein n=1 Tax=Teredinibacter purpureus TaxID=2731756 RepID=UPI0005F83565|nr:SapC family protein [Teredinibacter purpureus]
MFYQEPVALEKKKHVDLKLNRKQNYAFANNVNSVPLGGIEFFQTSRDYPILFVKNEKGEYLPMAILSLKKDSHDMGDSWEDVYIPAFIRRYPFALTPEKVVMFDNKAPHFQEDEGDRLFEEEDKPTETLQQVVGFLEAVDKSYRATEEYAKALGEKDLFEPYNATIKFQNGEVKMSDLHCINEKKLQEALSPEELQTWFKNGWLAWTYAHLHSLGSVGELVKRQRAAQETAASNTPASDDAPASDNKS